MNGYIANVSEVWFNRFKDKFERDEDIVWWNKSARIPSINLKKGTFCFIRVNIVNKILGYCNIKNIEKIRLDLAWDKYSHDLGYDSLDNIINASSKMTGREILTPEHDIFCIVLNNLKLCEIGIEEDLRANGINFGSKGHPPIQGQTYTDTETDRILSIINNIADLREKIVNDIEGLESEHNGRIEGEKHQGYRSWYERDPILREEAVVLHGFICTVCGFNFEDNYRERGSKYIEVHHLKPISEYEGGRPVNPETDMTVLCSNCHRMIHRYKNDVLSIDELRNYFG